MRVDESVTLVATDTVLVGEVRFANQLYVSGRVEGNVVATSPDATLVVSESGTVAGEVRVPHMVVNGLIEGEVFCTRMAQLTACGRVRGDLHYQQLEMELGASVEGHLIHDQQTDSAPEADNVHSIANAALDGQSRIADR